NEFRCPMCQNANLTSSPGGVAADLRREIYRMIIEGRTDQEIEEFMLNRYGDFILYRPRLTLQTVLLWFGPLLFLLIGIWAAFSIMRRSGGGDSQLTTESLSSEEELRLKQLLAQKENDVSDKA
ncbi:MAG: cytochrome c-type biogenesis protein, partial [Pseudohongiella sp.]